MAQPTSRDRRAAVGSIRRVLVAMAFVILAGSCGGGPPTVGAQLGMPLDLVAFTGITSKYPALHGYLAVASSQTNDIKLIDPLDDTPVLGPGVVYPLSIATAPTPIRVASAPLGDTASGGTDLLFTVSAGSLEVQVVGTWTAKNTIVASSSVSLAPLLGSGDITAIAAFTAPGAGPGNPRARALVAVTGGRLAVVDFTRDPQTGAVVPQQPLLQTIGFDALGIAIEPGGTRAFMATRDPVTGTGASAVFGVGVVDAGADPATPWPVTALDAKAPTVAVATALVNERLVDSTNPASPDTFQVTPQLRIYAVLDPAGCGMDRVIDCGVATLDAHGLVPDPAGELPYRAPFQFTGIVGGVGVALPPASGTSRITNDPNNPGLPLMAIEPGTRNTSAIAAVASSAGQVYTVDLSRYSPVNANTTTLTGTTRVSATTVVTALAPDVALTGTADFGKNTQLGLWSDFPVPAAAPTVVVDAGVLPGLVQVTPGYTTTDQWFVTWQGALPSLDAQQGIVGRAPTGETYVAIQANGGTASAPTWIVGLAVNDPGLGIHAGDLVAVVPDNPAVCPASLDPAHPYATPSVAADVQILPPDPALFPGGAIKLAPGTCFEAALAPGQTATATITVRASGLVLTSNGLGYLGRPVPNQPFLLQYKDATTLTGEALAVDRKLRRRFYPLEGPCPGSAPGQPPVAGCYAGYPWLADPLAPGPLIAFRAGFLLTTGVAGDPSDPAVLATIAPDTRLVIQTQSGLAPQVFKPTTGGVMPSTSVPYDRTAFVGHENDPTHIFTLFLDNQVVDFSPSVSGGGLISVGTTDISSVIQ